jgi:DNA-binding IclR family transcriptional regulator
MATKENKARTVQTSDTTFRIIGALHEDEGSTVTGLANRLSLAKSTVHDHLATLEQHGYVVKRDRQYHLGLRFLDHGTKVKTSMDFDSAARPVLKRLANETKVAAWAIVEENGYAVGLEREIGEEFTISSPRVGRRSHMHHQAGGKVILAHMPEESVSEIIETNGLSKATEQTITDESVLMEELEKIRNRGYAEDANEAIEGFGSISVPVLVEGTVRGAISVAGPTNRLFEAQRHDYLVELLKGAENEVSLNLQYPQSE